MAKGYKYFIKSDSPLSSNSDEPKVLADKEIDKMECENKKTTANDNIRHSSNRLIQKLRKIRLNSIPFNLDDDNSSDVSNNRPIDKIKTSLDVSKTISTPTMASHSLLKCQIDPKSTSNEKFELKGILKNTRENSSRPNSINNHNDIQSSQSNTTNNKENNDGLRASNGTSNNSNTTLNPSKTIKQVTFSEKISKKRYKPRNVMYGVVKLSSHQQKKLKKFPQNDSLKSRTRHSIDVCSIRLSHSQEPVYFDSSEYESSDSEDEITLTINIKC